MGTRSRILLRRSSKTDIYLWMHWDGGLFHKGKLLCEQLLHLTSKYSKDQLVHMVELLEIPYTDRYQNFVVEKFTAFVEGSTEYRNDESGDFEYEYIVDFSKEALCVKCPFGQSFITFDMLTKGFDITVLDDLWVMA
jgi:hypothetical protein